jgi:enamine deaminase RidA (YjgF/YER057c/UK114 family)
MQLDPIVSRPARAILLGAALCSALAPAFAQTVRIPLPNNSTFPISAGVWVGDTLYLSGVPTPSTSTAHDTEGQTVDTIKAIQAELKTQNLTLGDVVMMHVYLVGDPGNGGKLDFAGFMKGYTQFFGTKEQPNKPARSAMQVAALAAPTALVEIEVIAVKPK